MEDNRSSKVKAICAENIEISCEDCPLRKPCISQAGDDKQIWDNRMNAAAKELK
ncbi:MAG: hypothetical protein V3R25_10040 [Nitrosomonadaceae bacterium]